MDATAFCKILFGVMGGTFSPTGLPVFEEGVRGHCTRAFDCGSCMYMHEWLASLIQHGWTWGWECTKCLKETKPIDDELGIERRVQGFYQAGRRHSLTQEDPDFDPDRPGLEGCTRCGWESSFLQLVLRRPRGLIPR